VVVLVELPLVVVTVVVVDVAEVVCATVDPELVEPPVPVVVVIEK
jgi:hypothetical protein